jgi:hypothetical protein
MKQSLKGLLFASFFLILIGCTDGSGSEDEGNGGTDSETEASEETEDMNIDDVRDEYPDSQEGLRIGETGVVVDTMENMYEVTLNSISFKDTLGALGPNGVSFAIVNTTIENIGDKAFNIRNIYPPGLGAKGGSIEASINRVFQYKNVELEENLYEGMLEPGDSMTGDHIFDIDTFGDEYYFNFGAAGHQIVTYANWVISEDEIEGEE